MRLLQGPPEGNGGNDEDVDGGSDEDHSMHDLDDDDDDDDDEGGALEGPWMAENLMGDGFDEEDDGDEGNLLKFNMDEVMRQGFEGMWLTLVLIPPPSFSLLPRHSISSWPSFLGHRSTRML